MCCISMCRFIHNHLYTVYPMVHLSLIIWSSAVLPAGGGDGRAGVAGDPERRLSLSSPGG